jgi:hypothetical protein
VAQVGVSLLEGAEVRDEQNGWAQPANPKGDVIVDLGDDLTTR